jgi:uncharacterized protein (TIGR00369 family)
VSLERMQELERAFNEVTPIARYFGMTLAYTKEHNAVVTLPYNPNLDHPMGGVHGGVYATLLDVAGWFTAAAAHDGACWIATSEMSIHFLLPVKQTSLRAIGRLIKPGKRQDIAEMHLYDGQDHLVGHAMGTFMVLPDISLADMLAAKHE